MKPHFPATKAAADFANVLDGTAGQEAADRYAGLVATVTLLREHPAPTPRPDFVTELRSRLMTAAEVELISLRGSTGPTPIRSARSRRERHLGAAAAALVLIGTTAGVAVAAEGALPGNTLYPVKRGIEQAQISMNTNEAAKGSEYLNQARTRLAEVQSLLDSSDATSEQISSTLEDFNDHAAAGSDLLFASYQRDAAPSDINTVRDFAVSQMGRLAGIVELAPPTSGADMSAAADLLADIDQQARVLCGDCSSTAALTTPAALVVPGDAAALSDLVAAPAAQLSQRIREALPVDIAEKAKAAEQTARATEPETSTTPPSLTPGSTTGTPPNGGVPIGSTEKPVTQIVTGVTSGLPLPDSVKQVIKPVTDPLTEAVDNTLKGLGDVLK